MTSFRPLAATALLVVLATSACGGADTGSPDTPENLDTTPETTAPEATASDSGGRDAAGTPASSGVPGFAFSSVGSVEVEEDGVLVGWSALEGEPGVAIVGFLSGLDVVSIRFPDDFTVGEPIDLTADYTEGSQPNADIVLDRESFDEEIVSGHLTVTAADGGAITGTFEVTGRDDQGGQVTVTGTFANVPRE